jgi:hypothetical protein
MNNIDELIEQNIIFNNILNYKIIKTHRQIELYVEADILPLNFSNFKENKPWMFLAYKALYYELKKDGWITNKGIANLNFDYKPHFKFLDNKNYFVLLLKPSDTIYLQ